MMSVLSFLSALFYLRLPFRSSPQKPTPFFGVPLLLTSPPKSKKKDPCIKQESPHPLGRTADQPDTLGGDPLKRHIIMPSMLLTERKTNTFRNISDTSFA
jgi:hypothetical protein